MKGKMFHIRLSSTTAFRVHGKESHLKVKQWGAGLAERTELDALLKQARTARLELSKGTLGEVALQLGTVKVSLRKDYGAGSFGVDPNGTPIFTDPAGKAFPVKP